jgi:hypothetical protein
VGLLGGRRIDSRIRIVRTFMCVRSACTLLLLCSVVTLGQNEVLPQHTPPDLTQHLQEVKVFQKKPDRGYVPDTRTALRIDEAVLIPIYGARQIDYERPFNATLDGDVWTVSGSLHCKTTAKVICVGGTAVVQVSKTTGRNPAADSRGVEFKKVHHPNFTSLAASHPGL